MAKKRKYDTEALVGQIKRERRVSLGITFGGVFILCVIVGLYLLQSGGQPAPGTQTPPEPSTGPTAAPGAAAPSAPSGPAGASMAAAPGPSAPAPAPPEDKPASLTIAINKPSAVFLDGKSLGKVTKKKTLEVSAGKHTVSVKVGKKSFDQQLELAGGETGQVTIDVKKKKLSFKKT